ncbi:SigB/SigF/SigG family RNA polymerase sigma factor [Dactylosporangium cerinum]|uniref:SigB/SigF/SigG family RNA polymerase sigma factor n=1 Tax=Dactylosporangium cerinum TaxID=1434730 RepID=A0ABV9VUD8_9ACTN
MSTAVHLASPPAVPAGTTGGNTADGRRARWRRTDAAAWSLLTRLAELPPDHADRAGLRNQLIEMYLPLSRYIAQRFRYRGEPLDDLVQVANVALVKSVDRFDIVHGVPFPSYAIPMITGELKRHFRDRCWDVRVPRRIQELRLRINGVLEELTHELGRSPTVADLAARLDETDERIIEGLEATRAYRTLSLSTPAHGDDSTTELGDLLGTTDRDLEQVDTRESLRPLLARLPIREQRIVTLRFFGNLTQSQIAAELGMSQMHVSRLLTQILRTLHHALLAG